jgi:TetR/AcrR family transcriptional regulator, lmrAB and yxaGH operons repressor
VSGGERRASGSTKRRMLDSAALLLQEHGAAGVTIDAVLAHSGAPRGSVYHHFPGGRKEMILGGLRHAGDYITAMVDESVAEGDIRQTVARFVRFWKRALTGTDYRAGCPLVAVAIDRREAVPEAAELVREIFTHWRANLSELLSAGGFPVERASRLATLVVAAIEGAVVLARAYRDLTPLDDVLTEIAPLLEARVDRGAS